MKTKFTVVLATLSASMAFTACSDGPDGGRPTINEISLSRAESQVCEAMSAFGVDMFREVASDKTITDACPNFVVSPVSMATALSMLANATEGNVRSQICDALGCDDIQALNELNRKLMMFLPNPGRKCNIQLENSVWFRPEYTLTQPFKSAMSDYYFAPLAALDFKLQGSEDVINAWAARASHGILDRVVEHGEIEDAEALLANVTYFNGKWEDDYFDEKNTKDAVFHGIMSDATVPMMHGVIETTYVYQTDKWTAAKVFYNFPEIYIALVRPADGVSLGEIASSFTADDFKNIVDSKYRCRLTIDLPRFKSAADINFNETLKSMGINIDVVNPDAMFESCNIEMPMTVIHKAQLETNERGTVAAAYTGEGMATLPPPPPSINLSFDVPFMYFIYDKSAQTILMAGQFAQP